MVTVLTQTPSTPQLVLSSVVLNANAGTAISHRETLTLIRFTLWSGHLGKKMKKGDQSWKKVLKPKNKTKPPGDMLGGFCIEKDPDS